MRFRSLFAAGFVLAFSMVSVSASADERTLADATPWYGWQTLLVDVAAYSAAMALLPEHADSGATLWQGLGGPGMPQSLDTTWPALTTYLLASPLIHLAHGEAKSALLSFALRAAAPALWGTAFGIGKLGESNDWGYAPLLPVMGLAFTAVLVYPAAVIVDATVLAKERPAKPPAAARPSFAPTFAIGRTAALGVAGTF